MIVIIFVIKQVSSIINNRKIFLYSRKFVFYPINMIVSLRNTVLYGWPKSTIRRPFVVSLSYIWIQRDVQANRVVANQMLWEYYYEYYLGNRPRGTYVLKEILSLRSGASIRIRTTTIGMKQGLITFPDHLFWPPCWSAPRMKR